MSKKETRRAARQGQPKPVVRDRTSIRGTGAKKPQPRSGGRPGRTTATGRPLRPPTWKRAAIQGAIVAVAYLLIILLWFRKGTTTGTLVIFPLAGFIVFTIITYYTDRFTYQRRLRNQRGSSK